MRGLILLIVVATIGWGGSWFFSARSAERAAETWRAVDPLGGLVVSWDAVATSGFPNRLDTTAEGVRVTGAGVDWDFGRVAHLVLRYNQSSAVIVWPDPQTLRIGEVSWQIRSDQTRASVVPVTTAPLRLAETTVDVEGLSVDGPVPFTADRLLAAARLRPGTDDGAELFVETTGLLLGGAGSAMRADIALRFGAPVDGLGLGDQSAPVTGIELRSLSLRVGDSTIAVEGALDIDLTGLPSGDLTLILRDAGPILSGPLGAALFGPEISRLLAAADAEGPLPLRVTQGRLSTGGIDLGPLPFLAR